MILLIGLRKLQGIKQHDLKAKNLESAVCPVAWPAINDGGEGKMKQLWLIIIGALSA